MNDFVAMVRFRDVGTEAVGFRQFERTISTSAIEDVPAALREVEAACAEGFHAVGFVTYEAAPAFDPAMAVHPPESRLPLLWFALARDAETVDLAMPADMQNWDDEHWQAGLTRDEYRTAFAQIQEAIAAGATYQLNFTFPLANRFAGSSRALFAQMISTMPSCYGAWIAGDEWDVLSLSPELFFHRQADHIRTRPMKGTRRRGLSVEEDRRLTEELAASSKEQAENVMIVDLLRNDLGRIAVPGSVKVRSLFHIETYPTVLQMTSQVDARLPAEAQLDDIFTALFPCGSVTGAPKLKTMELIRTLERGPRGVYCGTVGYVQPGGEAVFNVAIRTMTRFSGGEVRYDVGSGVVADGAADAEYDECLVKAHSLRPSPAFSLLESLRFDPDLGYVLLEAHLERMAKSAAYFGYPWDAAAARAALFAESANFQAPQKVRLLLARDGEIRVEAAPLAVPGYRLPRTVVLANKPVRSDDIFLYHKTTHRQVYNDAFAERGDADEVLLYNERGELTESCFANVAVQLDGCWLTPPVASGLLPGTKREALLAAGEVEEAVVSIADLPRATGIRLFNSVRHVFDVTLV